MTEVDLRAAVREHTTSKLDDADASSTAGLDETVDVQNDALVEESMLVELTVDGQQHDAFGANVVDSSTVILDLDTDDLDASAGDTVEYTVSAGDGSDTGQLTIE